MSDEHFSHKKPDHCSDCGTWLMHSPHVQRFVMSNGSTIDASFCKECVKEEWTAQRLLALKAQMDDAYDKSVRGVFYTKVGDLWALTKVGAPWGRERATKELAWFHDLQLARPEGDSMVEQLGKPVLYTA